MIKVVIADDNMMLADGIRETISRNFPELTVERVFYSGRTLMAYLEDNTPDILITDILMPGYNGLDACRRIRETSSDAQIIIITGHAEFKYAQEAIRYHVCDLITKPFDNNILKEAIVGAILAPVKPLITYFCDAIQNVSMRDFMKSHHQKLATFSQRQLLFLLEESKKQLVLDCDLQDMISSDIADTLQRFAGYYYALTPHASITEKAKLFVRANYSDINLSLTMVAEHLAVNASSLSTLFKKECSIGLSDYISKVRMEHAKRLLTETDLSIRAISEQIGYNTDKYFSQAFKDVVGMTPTQYQKVKANEEN